MTVSACGGGALPDLPDAGGGACCWGAAVYGPRRCTCWTPEHDVVQAAPDTDAPVTTCARMCAGCAYRPGTQAHRAYAGELDDIALNATTFSCHEGARRVVRLRHPSGVTVDQAAAEPDVPPYDPVRVGDRFYLADGRPTPICAGWAARRRALTASSQPDIEPCPGCGQPLGGDPDDLCPRCEVLDP